MSGRDDVGPLHAARDAPLAAPDARCADAPGAEPCDDAREVTMRLTPIEKAPWVLGRLMDWGTRAMVGRSISPARAVYNRVPVAWRIVLAFAMFERASVLPERLRLLLTTHVAMLNGCEFCSDIKRALAVRARVGTERFDALATWRDSSLFSDSERAALAFVEEATRRKVVSDATFEELRRHHDERAVAEIALLNAVENFYNLVNVPLEIHSDGLEELARRRA